MTQKARAAARPPQTKVKHSILARYLAAWGGIIINGMRYQPKGSLHFVYVDCHASSGTYQGELEDVVERQPTAVVDGSPLIGIKGLDGLKQSAQQAGLSVQVNAILIEEKPARYQALCAAIDQAGFGARLKQTQRFMALQPDDIAVVHADSTTLVRDLVAYTQSEWRYALYLLDPYGPKGIPMSFVRYIVPLPRHDVMSSCCVAVSHRNERREICKRREAGDERRGTGGEGLVGERCTTYVTTEHASLPATADQTRAEDDSTYGSGSSASS